MAASECSRYWHNVDVIEAQWVPSYDGEVLYATRVWLDPLQDRLWFVDGNLSLKVVYTLYPSTVTVKRLGCEKLLPSEHGGPVSFVNKPAFNTIFVGGSIDAGPQVRTLNRYDMDEPYNSFDAFPDDEAIFSAMDSNERCVDRRQQCLLCC